MPDRGETKSLKLFQLDTSKLVALLQQSAVEHFTTYREIQELNFDPFVTPDFKALYAYKCGQYRHCLQLSARNIRTTIVDKSILYLFVPVYPAPEFIQLMDDDIVSLIGLIALINPPPINDRPLVVIHQLTLSLYLMTQCQIKLGYSVTSLATTLDYVQLARFCRGQLLKYAVDLCRQLTGDRYSLVDQHVLKYVEQKISRYVSLRHKK